MEEDYMIVINASEDTLQIEVEEKLGYKVWCCNFLNQIIESFTAKAGSAKKYETFILMLLQALTQATDSLFIDFRTHQDIQIMQAKQTDDAEKLMKAQSLNS